jgi:hypothetical protein
MIDGARWRITGRLNDKGLTKIDIWLALSTLHRIELLTI